MHTHIYTHAHVQVYIEEKLSVRRWLIGNYFFYTQCETDNIKLTLNHF